MARVDALQALGIGNPVYVTFVDGGRHAGAVAVLNTHREVVVFRVR